jgi:hypothetical protein
VRSKASWQTPSVGKSEHAPKSFVPRKLQQGLSRFANSTGGYGQPTLTRCTDEPQFNEVKSKVDRIHFKSLAGILALQEKIGNECARRWASLPAVKPVAVK